ncbi:cyclin-I [Osmerus mordax]|uniref:cyclin-I-like n=1 Tax=Osmerus mordax TaxID=8014 RepID=UPI00350F0117
MKFAEPLESQRLSFLLEKAASREAKMWKVYVPKKVPTQVQDTDISNDQRDEAVRWLTALHSKLHLYPETLSLAISILDRFLASIKARPKYLRCIAIACFFLATKTSEEDERVPLLQDLASTSSCGCSPSEILRMEKIILDKLSWDLHAATPLEFLQIFHAMVLSCKSPFLVGLLGLNPSQHMALLTQQLHHCLADHTLLQFRGSMLALALITLELETCCPDWLALTIDLLRKAQIDSSQLIRCRELVAHSLSTSQASLPPNTVYIYQPLHQSLVPRNRGSPVAPHRAPLAPAQEPPSRAGGPHGASGTTTQLVTLKPYHHPHLHRPHQQVHRRCKHSSKRKVEEMEVDDFYDGIKRLYNEESVQEGAAAGEGHGLGCGVLLVWQEGSTSPCPPLQPVSVT